MRRQQRTSCAPYTQTVFNDHHTDRAAEFLARDVTWHGGTLGTMDGVDNVAAMVRGIIAALPDLTATEQGIIAEGDTVAVRYVVEATHTGDLLGIPATGRRVRWDAVDVVSRRQRQDRRGMGRRRPAGHSRQPGSVHPAVARGTVSTRTAHNDAGPPRPV